MRNKCLGWKGYFHNHYAKNGVDTLENILGNDVFRKYVNVLLTDRGSEFYAAKDMETDVDSTTRTRVFYCDPMQSGQKGSIENNHIQLRYILPKQTDLVSLGLNDQDALNLVLSHLNSAPVEKFGGKSPLEVASFYVSWSVWKAYFVWNQGNRKR